MSTWTRLADDVFAAVLRQCYAGLDAATLHQRAIAQLRRAVPFEGYCAHDADPATGLPIRLYLDPPDEQGGRTFLEQAIFVDEATRATHRREVLATQGFECNLFSVYASGGSAWGGISAFRERGSREFTEREAALVRRLAPHLAAGLKAAMLLAPSAQRASAPPGPGVLMLNRHERVSHYTPAAEYWLRQLTNLPPGWQEGRGLPAVVWVAVAKLRQGLHPIAGWESAAVPSARARTMTGAWIQVQAALCEGPDGESGDTVLMIELLGPREVSWLRLAAYDLTPREQEVADLVGRGISTRHISQALCITEYTVQDHLKSIFDKTGVRSRRELVQHLYLDGLAVDSQR